MSSTKTHIQDNDNRSMQFEKVRLEYCMRAYNEEGERKERLEKKSQFYLSFVTLLVGAIFLNLDSLLNLKDLVPQSAGFLVLILLYALLGGALLSMFVSLVAILGSIHLQSYAAGFPTSIFDSLFAPDSEYLIGPDAETLLRAEAMTYADAVETNSSLNKKKAKWVRIASYCAFSSVILMTLLIALIIYLLVSQ